MSLEGAPGDLPLHGVSACITLLLHSMSQIYKSSNSFRNKVRPSILLSVWEMLSAWTQGFTICTMEMRPRRWTGLQDDGHLRDKDISSYHSLWSPHSPQRALPALFPQSLPALVPYAPSLFTVLTFHLSHCSVSCPLPHHCFPSLLEVLAIPVGFILTNSLATWLVNRQGIFVTFNPT